jgi:hypothetical protein
MLSRSYWIATGIIGAYECTRGFRATYQFDRKEKTFNQMMYLTGDRVVYSVLNGAFYMLPGWNVVALLRFANRVEIDIRKLEKTSFPYNYEGILGRYCPDTF